MCGCKGLSSDKNAQDIGLTIANASLDDFAIENAFVVFECQLDVKNSANAEKKFEIVGNFSEDQKSGLIIEKELIAVDPETASTAFRLDASSEKHITIRFVGTYAENPVKENRNPPELSIREINP